ncbi:hypothetical protein F5884DRAFT_893093 [Xylogone sp. PMI_703]|nr:hypothetical protein F5884DRAFT_893093 [Xylogone sp. PMI_703]
MIFVYMLLSELIYIELIWKSLINSSTRGLLRRRDIYSSDHPAWWTFRQLGQIQCSQTMENTSTLLSHYPHTMVDQLRKNGLDAEAANPHISTDTLRKSRTYTLDTLSAHTCEKEEQVNLIRCAWALVGPRYMDTDKAEFCYSDASCDGAIITLSIEYEGMTKHQFLTETRRQVDCGTRVPNHLITNLKVKPNTLLCVRDNNTPNPFLADLFDLTVDVKLGRQASASYSFNLDIFSAVQIERINRQFSYVFPQLISPKNDAPLANLHLLNPHDRLEIDAWNQVPPKREDDSFDRVLKRRVRTQGQALAICGWDGNLTYHDLDRLSDNLAHYLLVSGYAGNNGIIIPICFEKSALSIIAMIAIQKAGAAYTILDPTHPEDRLHVIVSATKAETVIASKKQSAHISHLVSNVVVLDTAFLDRLPQKTISPKVSSSTHAYIQFTSGSTGEPKGIIIDHEALCTTMAAYAHWGLGTDTRFLQFASLVFDVSVVEIFCTLYYGGCVCVPPGDKLKDQLADCIREWQVNTAVMTPTGASHLLHPDQVPNLRTVFLGGEPVTAAITNVWASRVELYVAYGLSETTFACTGRRIFPDDKQDPQDIGKGVNSRCWIVDPQDHDRLLPIGCVGELLIESGSLSVGYLNDPVKTAHSFIMNPGFLPSEQSTGGPIRMLKTGDLARYSSEGSLIYIGRKDTQAKWNGIRIDLEEVSHCLKSSLAGSWSVVADVVSPEQLPGRRFLTAFLFLGDTAPTVPVDELILPLSREVATELVNAKNMLQAKVPHYMVPQLYVPLKKMPTNISGKTDRKMLKRLGATLSPTLVASYGLGTVTGSAEVELSAIELLLQAAWAEVLRMPVNIVGNGNFFHLGGDSVAAMRLVARMHQEGFSLAVADCFRHPQLVSMAAIMVPQRTTGVQEAQDDPEQYSLLPTGGLESVASIKGRITSFYEIEEKLIDDLYPCTPMQESLMALAAQAPGTYVSQNALSLSPEIDIQRLLQAWELVYQETPILRATLVDTSEYGTLVLVLRQKLTWNKASNLHDYLRADRDLPMTYGSNLSRFAVIESAKEKYLVFTWHHSILDGWALHQVFSRVMDVYEGTTLQKSPSFGRFIRYLSDCDREAARRFWHSELEDAAPTRFPPSFQPARETPARTGPSLELSLALDFQAQGDFTLSNVLQAAWALVVAAYSDSKDVVFGVVSSCRHVPVAGISDIIGPTIATIPYRVRVKGDMNVAQFLSELQAKSTAVMNHEHFGLQNIAKLGREYAKICQFENLLIVQPHAFDIATAERGGVAIMAGSQYMSYDYPLIMECQLGSGQVKFRLQYDGEILSSGFVDGILHHMAHVTKQLVLHQSRLIRDIEIFSSYDESRISGWMQLESVPQQLNECVHAIVTKRQNELPQSPAVCAWDGTFTYHELETWSNIFAQHLLALGLIPGIYVPICFEKSKWAVVVMLALIKCGTAYVALDPNHPTQRLQSIVQSAGSRIIIASQQNVDKVRGLAPNVIGFDADRLLQLQLTDAPSLPQVLPSDPIVIQFTSGSTGQPKGIVIQHSALCSSSRAHASFYGIGRETRMFNFAAFVFDVSVADIWTTLMHGGCACIPKDEDRYSDVSKAMRELGANMSFLTPSVATLLDPRDTPLKKLILGGERVTYELVDNWSDSLSLVACYGPAETCIYSSATPALTKSSNPSSIGKPFGCRYWVVDTSNHDRLAPVGCVGELWIEGPILAREYLNDPTKTAASFIQNPAWAKLEGLLNNRRFYRTGDLVRYDTDGSVMFVARKDTQVKISGQRVELAEVEHSFSMLKEVKSAAVVLPESGLCKSKLAAVLVLKGNSSNDGLRVFKLASVSGDNELPNIISRIRKHLSLTLAPYMVPSFLIVVEALPHNLSGKIDKGKVRAWMEDLDNETRQRIMSQSTTKHNPSLSLSTTEETMQSLCANVMRMQTKEVLMDQDFISMGGDSISAIRLVILARNAGLGVKVKDILTSASLFELCSRVIVVDSVHKDNTKQDSDSPASNVFGASMSQELYYQALQSCHCDNGSVQSLLLHLSPSEATVDLQGDIDELVKRHDMLRVRFRVGNDNQLLQVIDPDYKASYHFAQNHLRDSSLKDWLQQHPAQLNITTGPVFGVNVLIAESGDTHLLISGHTLIMDRTSWSIIADELKRCVNRQVAAESTPSYREWCEYTSRTRSRIPQAEGQSQTQPPAYSDPWPLKLYSPQSKWLMQSVTLDPSVSASLTGDCNRVFRTTPDDVLIAALMHSFANSFTEDVPISLVAGFDGRSIHGRQLDMSRTIGLFSIPVIFNLSGWTGARYLDTVRRVKDTRYQTLEGNGERTPILPKSPHVHDLSFHFMDTTSDLTSELFPHVKPWQSYYTPINVTVVRKGQDLAVHFQIDSGHDNFKHFKQWLAKCEDLLQTMSFEMPHMPSRPTLVNYPQLHATYEELDGIYSQVLPRFGIKNADMIEDIYPCSSVQEGMLIARDASSKTFYEAVSIFEVKDASGNDPVDADRLHRAWRRVVERHPLLRTVFFESLSKTRLFDQAVLKNVKDNTLRITCDDNEAMTTLQMAMPSTEDHISSTHKATICQTQNGRTFFKLELLHTCYDGQSTQNILRDLSAAYGDDFANTSGFPYSRYVSHLQTTSISENLEFWTKYVKDVRPTHLNFQLGDRGANASLSTMPVVIPDTKDLLDWSRKHGLTIANVIKTAWGIVLRQYTQSDDICFGFVASGRDTPIDGIVDGVGPYIKQLVCRAKLEGPTELGQAMHSIQSECFDCLAHQNIPLIEIQHLLRLGGAQLFNTNMSLVHIPRGAFEFSNLVYDYVMLADPAEYDITVRIEVYEESFDILLSYWSHSMTNQIAAEVSGMFAEALSYLTSYDEKTVQDVSDCLLQKACQRTSLPSTNVMEMNAPRESKSSPLRHNETASTSQLRSLFADVLQLEPNNIDDNADFFQCGGDSLAAVQLILKARAQGIHITMGDIFQSKNLQDLFICTNQNSKNIRLNPWWLESVA